MSVWPESNDCRKQRGECTDDRDHDSRHGDESNTTCIHALFAAVVAFGQTDIKKVLAYSTVSQLGFMFIAVGGRVLGGDVPRHDARLFKALLFLGAGRSFMRWRTTKTCGTTAVCASTCRSR